MVDWDLMYLDELIEKNRTERLDQAMEDLGYVRPYRDGNTNGKTEVKKKKSFKNKRKK